MKRVIFLALLMISISLTSFNHTVFPDVGPSEINPEPISIETNVKYSINSIESEIELGSEIAKIKAIYELKFDSKKDNVNFDLILPRITTYEEGYPYTQKNTIVSLLINDDLQLPQLLQIDNIDTNLSKKINRDLGNYYQYKILAKNPQIKIEINYEAKILRKSGNLYCDFRFNSIPNNFQNIVKSVYTKVSFADIDISSITNFTTNGKVNANQEIIWKQKNIINQNYGCITINFEKNSGIPIYIHSSYMDYLSDTFYYDNFEIIEFTEFSDEIKNISERDSVEVKIVINDVLSLIFEIAESKNPTDALTFYLWIKSEYGDVLNISKKFSYLNFKIAECYFSLCEFEKAKKYYSLLIDEGSLSEKNIKKRGESLFYKGVNQISVEELFKWDNYLSSKGLIEYCKIKLNAIDNLEKY